MVNLLTIWWMRGCIRKPTDWFWLNQRACSGSFQSLPFESYMIGGGTHAIDVSE